MRGESDAAVVFVPLAGDPAELDLAIPVAGGFRVNPTGRQINVVRRELRREVYVLENFLPATGARK